MYKCPNCGQHHFKLVGKYFVCETCGEKYLTQDLEEAKIRRENALDDARHIIEDSYTRQLESLHHRFANDAVLKQQIEDLQAQLDKAEQIRNTLDKDGLTETIKSVLDEYGLKDIKPGIDKAELKELIDDSVKEQVSALGDEILARLPIKQDATEEKVKELGKTYTALDLIERAFDNSIDAFTAPAAMIRHSIEGYVKKHTEDKLENVTTKYYFHDIQAAKQYYDQYASDCKRLPNKNELMLFALMTGRALGKQPLPKKGNKTVNDYMKKDTTCPSCDLGMRFFVAGIPASKIYKMCIYWNICNLFVHDGAFETVLAWDTWKYDLNSWKDNNKEQMQALFTGMYEFAKSLGIPMIGDKN